MTPVIRPAAPPSGFGDLHYTHTQSSPSAVWSITHNLGKHPSVTVQDTTGNEVENQVEHIDLNSLVVTFSAAFSGRADLN